MLESMAAAICGKMLAGCCRDACPMLPCDCAMKAARAAVEAMRVRTNAMMAASIYAERGPERSAKIQWDAALDAILAEGQSRQK